MEFLAGLAIVAFIVWFSFSKLGKKAMLEAKAQKLPFAYCSIFGVRLLAVTFCITVADVVAILIDNAVYSAYWISDFLMYFSYGLCVLLVLCLAFVIFCFICSSVEQRIQETADRQVRSGQPAGERHWVFYAVVWPALVLIPYFLLRKFTWHWSCFAGGYGHFELKQCLGWLPVGLVVSSIILDIAVIVSNKKHNIGMADFWSRFTIVFALIVTILYPLSHAFAVSIDKEHYSSSISVDWTLFYFFLILAQCIVSLISGYVVSFVLKFVGGYDVHIIDDLPSLVPDCNYDTPDSYRSCGTHGSYGSYDSDAPEGSSSNLDDTLGTLAGLGAAAYLGHELHKDLTADPTADYYGRHGEFASNDYDRAICEDMQQMHACNPDADLEAHFGWENVLNYETDDFGEDN